MSGGGAGVRRGRLTGPLAGKRILVTRPRAQAGELARLIREAGGEPLVFPAIEIRAPSDPAALRAVLDRLERFDLAIFISRNAVEHGLAALERPWPARLQVAAIGAGTRRALEARGLRDVIAPAGQADSEALLALPALRRMEGRRAVIFRGEGGRELLRRSLEERGAIVAYAECYRRVRPEAGGAGLRAAWARGEVHAVTVNSAEALANLWAILGEPAAEAARRTPLFVPHPRVAEAALRRGLREVIVAGAGDAEMRDRLVAYFARGEAERR
jgi:uroporphyrinogen-III synthase